MAKYQREKGKKDQDVSKVYAKFGIEVYAAAKSGEPDPDLNQKLKFVIDRAKTYNVPAHVINKAIEKARAATKKTSKNFVMKALVLVDQ